MRLLRVPAAAGASRLTKLGLFLAAWIFECVNVGDCKAFLFSPKTRQILDITDGNRTSLKNARDPGGRLGGYTTSSASPTSFVASRRCLADPASAHQNPTCATWRSTTSRWRRATSS